MLGAEKKKKKEKYPSTWGSFVEISMICTVRIKIHELAKQNDVF